MNVKKILAPVLPPLLLLGLAGCVGGHRTVYLDTEADFSLIRRVAVLPFENLTSDANAGEKVRRLFIIELLSKKVVDVVDPGEVARTLMEQRVDNVSNLGPKQLVPLADAMNAEALILGTVQEFGMDRSGAVSTPQVSITCRMLDPASGRALWSAAVSRGGAGAMSRLFGVSGDTTTEATRKMVRDALKSLVK